MKDSIKEAGIYITQNGMATYKKHTSGSETRSGSCNELLPHNKVTVETFMKWCLRLAQQLDLPYNDPVDETIRNIENEYQKQMENDYGDMVREIIKEAEEHENAQPFEGTKEDFFGEYYDEYFNDEEPPEV